MSNNFLAIWIIAVIFATITPVITYNLYKHLKMPVFVVNKAELADNGSLNIRYTILKPKKLKTIKQIYLVDEATGNKIDIPATYGEKYIFNKLKGQLAPGCLILMCNKGIVKTGSKLTLYIGDYKDEHIQVTADRYSC